MNTATTLAEPTPTQTNDKPLSPDQEASADAVINFLLNPEKEHFVLAGFAGTGKSTLLRHIIHSLPKINKLAKVIGNDDTNRTLHLTATTNKAAGAVRQTAGFPADTIHSALGLGLERDPDTHKQVLGTTHRSRKFKDDLFIIDEGFMADPQLLRLLDEQTENCKVLWVGDPAQLTPVGYNYCPLERFGYETTTLTEVHRQAKDNPIIDLATLCRYAVLSGNNFKFKPDGEIIKHVPRAEFERLMLEDFDAHGRSPGAIKTLAWTNKATIGWNNHVKERLKGTLEIQVNDYVVANSAFRQGRWHVSNDEVVQITGKKAATREGLAGHYYEINAKGEAFMPDDVLEKNRLLRALRREGSNASKAKAAKLEDSWIDLRDEYACTINKSQGSTYGVTYIDLDDLKRCNSINLKNRLFYVGVTRPSDRIVFTGDIR